MGKKSIEDGKRISPGENLKPTKITQEQADKLKELPHLKQGKIKFLLKK